MVARYGQSWAAASRARVDVIPYDPHSSPEAASADLWIITPARLPHWAAAGKLHAVPDRLQAQGPAYAWQDLLPLYRNKLLIWDRKAYALPLLGEAFLCYYRADLLGDAKDRQSFKEQFGHELPPPSLREITWEQFQEIASFFHNRPRPGSGGRYPSLPPLPALDDELDREFYCVATPFARQAVEEEAKMPPPPAELFSFHYQLGTGAPRIQTPGFVHALKLLRQLQAFRPAAAAKEPPASFEKGEAVLCLADAAWISRFQSSPQVRGKFAFCRPPGSSRVFDFDTGQERPVTTGNYVPYLGSAGWLAVVPRSSAQPQAAFELAASMGNPTLSRNIVVEPDWGGGVFRRGHLENSGWTALGLNPSQTERLLDLLREIVIHARTQNPVLRLRIPDEQEHQLVLDKEVRAALTGGKEPSQALQDAARQWQELYSRKPLAQRLAEYRLSLSLSGTD
jgi:hypothetical protein